jgi:hypothetical protein
MIKSHIEEAVRRIEAEKNQAIASAKERVTREKVLPYNAEVDRMMAEAIAAKQNTMNGAIKSLQEDFAEEKRSIIEAAEKNKADNANCVINAEVSLVSAEYDRNIEKLKKQIEDLKE